MITTTRLEYGHVLTSDMDLLLATEAPPPLKCDRYYASHNKTVIIYGGYEGIPENLLMNFTVWVVLLIVFSFLRKIAWDYGRLALVNRTESSTRARWTSLFYGDHSSRQDRRMSQESLDMQVQRQDKTFCSWIPAFFRIKDENILEKSGQDAVQYLTFQRYLIVYMTVIVVCCITIVLPINFQGEEEGNSQAFGHTTISNLEPNSPIFWLHSSLAVVFLVIIVAFMRHFSAHLHYRDDDQATRTLMISNIARDKCSSNLMTLHFQEAYPEATLCDIQFAYSISKLVKLDKHRMWAVEGLVNSEAILKQTGSPPVLYPYVCGQCCGPCCASCGCRPVDAIEYYRAQEAKYRALVNKQKVKAFHSTLGIAFVTLETDQLASRVYSDFKVSCKGAHNPMTSSVSRQLNAHNWDVKYAPTPDNIFWENLSVQPAEWWMRAIAVNTLLFILLFFFTTPSLLLNLLNQGGYKKAVAEFHSPMLVQFLPTLILWMLSCLLPNIVYYTDFYLIGHWTRSSEHHAVMRKTFAYLLLMVLALPSLGLTSAKALFEWLTQRNEDDYKFRWQCIFIPDNGAFFVNYVITSAFVGTAAELVRIPELFMYSLKLCLAKSQAERTSLRKSALWEFQFGMQYAWMLCVFSVTMAFSIPCPLITPFGLLYLIFKHLVDRYNIYFAYGPSKIDKHIHASAVNFVMVAVIILQISLLFFMLLRANMVQGILIFSSVVLFITLIFFFGRLCFGWFRNLSPISYKPMSSGSDASLETETCTGPEPVPFIPSVLMNGQEDELTEPASTEGAMTTDYGAMATDEVPVVTHEVHQQLQD